MTAIETVSIAVTEEHIKNGQRGAGEDPIELAIREATPGAVKAHAGFTDAELREMVATVWLAGDDFLAPSLALTFTLPREAFDFLNDFVDGKPVSPFRFTAERRPA